MKTVEHIVIQQQITGSIETWRTVYCWDRERFTSRAKAIKHGWEVFDHDDFNVGVLIDGELSWFGWMDEELDRELLPEIAAQLGLSAVES